MGVRIGWLGQRAEVALQVASVAAAAGAEVVVADPDGGGPEAATGSGVDLVLVDGGCGAAPGSWQGWRPSPARRRPGAVVVHLAGEAAPALATADALQAEHVVELPRGETWLADLVRTDRPPGVLGVLGSVGGAGTSTVAVACAAAAGAGSLLVDADPWSPGLDLPLGIPEDAGGRWSAVPDTAEPLVGESLRAALPVVRGVTVATGPMPRPAGGRIAGVVRVGRHEFARTVVDCGRDAGAIGWQRGDAAVVVTPATLGGVVGARRLLDELPVDRVVLAIRPTGWLSARDVADQLGVQRHLAVPRLARAGELADCADLLSGRTGRALLRLGSRVWGAVA